MSEEYAKPRARDLGLPFDGETGEFNAITDVAGVEVGFTTLIEGQGAVEVGREVVRVERRRGRIAATALAPL